MTLPDVARCCRASSGNNPTYVPRPPFRGRGEADCGAADVQAPAVNTTRHDPTAAAIAAAVAEALAARLEGVEAGLATLAEAVASPVPEPLLDRRGAAEWAGCSTRQVDHWLREGAPCVRLGGPGGSPRMRASELLAWLRSRTEVGHE